MVIVADTVTAHVAMRAAVSPVDMPVAGLAAMPVAA
jgi:hypothetical protein